MGNLIAFEWLSADGVFDADIMDEWFFPYDSQERRKLIKDTYKDADALLMGRNTYEMLAPYWSRLPDDAEDGIAGVLTHTPKFVASDGDIVANWGETTMLNDDVEAEIKKLKQKIDNILIIGSATLSESLAQAGLIDEYKLLVQPFIMGTGRRFFSEGMKTPVRLVKIEQLNPDLLLLDYQVKDKIR